MWGTGQISIIDIKNKYNLGFNYAKNVAIRLEEIGYIKKRNEYSYIIIKTEQEIDDYIRYHIKELRPAEYDLMGMKDNGDFTLINRIKMKIDYLKSVVPVFIRRFLFSIPQLVVIILFFVILPFINFNNKNIKNIVLFYICFIFAFYIFFALPLNICIRIIQANIYKMNFIKFMLLPKNWFFARCKNYFELCKLLHENKIKFQIGNYDELLKQIKIILIQKKNLAEHYANLANNAQNENEFYQSVNSCISTLKWMSQFERFEVFSNGQIPSKDILRIQEEMPISIDRFNKRMKDIYEKNKTNFDKMDGHDFEYYCANILRKNGFKNVEVTQGSKDHGVDILAEKDDITYAIQCKCYSSNIGNSAIQQAHTGKYIYKKDVAVVMTNQYFTKQAIEEAMQIGVKLWDRDKLNELNMDN